MQICKIIKYVALYFILMSFQVIAHPGLCHNNENINCENLVMNQLPEREYDDANEYIKIRNACLGHSSTYCLDKLIQNTSTWDRNSLNEMLELTTACKYSNRECLDYAFQKIPSYDYNSRSEIVNLASACSNSSLNCTKRLCNTRQYNCSRTRELLSAMRTCQLSCN